MFTDLLICLRFFSRLPVPATEREIALGRHGLVEAAAMAPAAGAVIGGLATALLAAGLALHLPATLAAAIAIAASVMITGALHEDALGDCADGFGGGRDREAKLAIMRDSRIGAYGACAIALSLYIRAAALAAACLQGSPMALVVAAILSRAACLLPLASLPPARPDGSGSAAASLPLARFGQACGLGLPLAGAFCWMDGLGPLRFTVAVAAAATAALAVTLLARRQIGGQTGDVAGAAQQLAELAVLMVLAAGPARSVPALAAFYGPLSGGF